MTRRVTNLMKNKRGGTVKYANDLSNSTFVDQVGFCMQNINEKYGAIIGKENVYLV